MGERTPTPWQIYDVADPHHIMIKGFYPVLGGAHVADVLFHDNAAFIVTACNSHDALVKALLLARARIHYLGAVCSNKKHFEANASEFLPAIDEALAKVSA